MRKSKTTKEMKSSIGSYLRSILPPSLPPSLAQVMYFAPVIFKKFLASDMAILANLAISLVNYLSTFLALYLVDKAGRRPLLVMGGVGMAVFTGKWRKGGREGGKLEKDRRVRFWLADRQARWNNSFQFVRSSLTFPSFSSFHFFQACSPSSPPRLLTTRQTSGWRAP